MFLSILCYTIASIILYMIGKEATKHSPSIRILRGESNWLMVGPVMIATCFFALFFGIRSDHTGIDTTIYIKFYDYFCKNHVHIRENIEPAYKWLTEIFATLELPSWVFLAFFGFIQIYFVYLAVKEERYLWPLIGVYIIMGPIFLDWANGMRQCVVECVFLFAVKFIAKKNLVPYVITIAVCSLMHTSALLLIPLYWLVKIRTYPKSKLIRVLLVIICVIVGQTPTWMRSMDFMSTIMGLAGYDWYSQNLDKLAEETRTMAFGPSRLMILAVWIWIVIKIPNVIRQMKLPRKFQYYFNIFFLGVCLYNLFANTSHIFLRPIGYFTAPVIILAPLLLYFYIKQHKHTQALALGTLMFSYAVYISIKGAMMPPGQSYELYSFFFLD